MTAPPWALSAEAIDGVGDTHLPPGIHVRALPSPRAGVPSTPLFVFRTDLPAQVLGRLAHRKDITWVDAGGNVLTMPFEVTPGNPVTGHLPFGQCIWAQLFARPSRALAFDALVQSPNGPAVVARRTDIPYALGAQRIDAVQVSGQGQVFGFQWMARDDFEREEKGRLIAIWSLPVGPMARYRPTPNARQEAKDRVLRGAPSRRPMYAAFAATGPGAAPAAMPADALQRIDLVAAELDRWLQALLDDLGTPPGDVLDKAGIEEVAGTVAIPIEPHVIATAVDPDAGRWLGFGDVDKEVKSDAGGAVVYRIRGLWRWEADRWDLLQRMVLAGSVRSSLSEAVQAFPELKQAGLVPDKDGQFLDLSALAVAAVGTPPARPGRPQNLTSEDRGWLPEPPPPDVRRAVRLRAGGFVPHVISAFAARDSRGLRTLNPVFKKGRARPGETPPPHTILPLTVTRPVDSTGPGQGRFDDRDAPEGIVEYRVAQGDWFGRWSEWAELAAPAKARTTPPQPSVELAYAPPTFPAGPLPETAERGTLTVRVPVPRAAELPAGGHRLLRLEVERRVDGGAPALFTFVLNALAGAVLEPHPSPGHDTLVVTSHGPPIPRAGFREIRVTARWFDEGGLVSLDSAPAVRQLLDPRPPTLPPVPTELLYSARPDATGFARVELSWPSSPGTRYRVFASTETTLLGALRNAGLGSAADAIQATPAGALRAMALRARKSDLSWDAFECVTASPLVASGATTTFVHRVSGSLDGLAVYRVLTEGASGVLADMTQAELIPVAVPNYGPPVQPLVSIERDPENHEHHGVSVRVRVPPGLVVPVAWRLRRASVAVTDPLRMDVVATGSIPPGTGSAAAGTELTINDPTPLLRWRQYWFSVEVQAGPPPGAPSVGDIPAGEWSPASAPATVAVIPFDPPAAPTSVVAVRQVSGVRLTVTHADADSLIGTAFGSHRFEVYRLSPGARPALLELVLTRAAGLAFEGVDTTAPAPPAASRWAVRVVDPISRTSDTTLSGEA